MYAAISKEYGRCSVCVCGGGRDARHFANFTVYRSYNNVYLIYA